MDKNYFSWGVSGIIFMKQLLYSFRVQSFLMGLGRMFMDFSLVNPGEIKSLTF